MSRTPLARLALALGAKAEPLEVITRALLIVVGVIPAEYGLHEAGLRARERWPHILDRREYTFRLLTPRHDRAFALRALAEHEPQQHVQAPEREEEEGGHKREVVDVVGEDRRSDEALEDAEWPEAERCAQHGEESVKEAGGPADLGEDEDDNLEDDEQTVHDGPENTGRLVGDCARSRRNM